MARRWLWRIGLGTLLPVIAAIAWFSIPLFVSPANMADRLKQSLADRGLTLGYEQPASMIMDPMPAIDLGPITVTGADGDLVLQGARAQARPSAWMLAGGDAAVGSLVLAGAELRIPATLLSDQIKLSDATITLNRGADGALGGRFTGSLGADEVSGTYGIGNLDALLSGRVSAVTVAASGTGHSSSFEGTARRVTDAPLPDLVGTLTHRIEKPQDGLFGTPLPSGLKGLDPVSLTLRLNAKASGLAIQAQALSAMRDRPLNVTASFKGKAGWADDGMLDAEITARAGGLLSAQFAGRMDWRAPFAEPVSGPGQLVVLELPELLDLLDLGPGMTGLPVQRIARLKGDWSLSEREIAFERTEMEYDGVRHALNGMLRFGTPRPQLSVDTRLDAIALEGLGEASALLRSFMRLPMDLSARIGTDELRVGAYAARAAQLALDARATTSSATILRASVPGGEASGRLSLDPGEDRIALTLEINGADMSPLTGGALTGAGVGRADLRWPAANPADLSGRGELSVYAGTLAGVDIGGVLSGAAQSGQETRFAALAGELGIAGNVVDISSLTISGAGWSADGEISADLASGEVSGTLASAEVSGQTGISLAIAGTVEDPRIVRKRIEPVRQEPPQTSPEPPVADAAQPESERLPETRLVAETETTRALTGSLGDISPPIPPRAPR